MSKSEAISCMMDKKFNSSRLFRCCKVSEAAGLIQTVIEM